VLAEARDSARSLTPRSMSRDIRASAGTMRSQPPRVNHHGVVFHLDRNRKRVRWPASIGVREKAQVQSSVALCFSRQLAGRWEVECSANALCGSRRSTMKPHLVSGAPSGMKPPRRISCSPGMTRFALGQFAGNGSLSTPASCVPASPMPAHLHKPWPDGFRRGVDGRGVVGHHLRVRHYIVAGKRLAAFLGCGSVGLAEMYQSQFSNRSRG
jgi:hypothetical protein